MALDIRDPETDALARRLAELTGRPVDEAVKAALRAQVAQAEQLASAAEAPEAKASVEEIMAIARRIASGPILDTRSDDEILGYDDRGLPS
mgnify:CR=1 FL=1